MTTRGRSALVFIFALAASPLAAAPFLVPDVPYRCNADQVTGANYTINFVEFRDNGKPWCETELNDALAQIREAREQNPRTVVLIYVHGWKNNASEELSDDVTRFRNEVDRISLILPRPEAGKKPPLIGIYMAWRGLTLTVEPFKTLSYWDRRGTARHVGQTGPMMRHSSNRQDEVQGKGADNPDLYRPLVRGAGAGEHRRRTGTGQRPGLP